MSAPISQAKRWMPSIAGGLLGKRCAYLDSACSTPTPQQVAAAVAEFYSRTPGCPLRAATTAANELENRIGLARDAVRSFIHAKFSQEIIFTPNTTFGINLLASAFRDRPGAVLISDSEHNSNRLPWLAHARCELPWPPGTPFPFDAYRERLRSDLKLVSLASVSNVTGAGIPVRDVVRAAHDAGVPVHLDAAQEAAHQTIDVGETQPDFMSFSLHKAYGPSGLGVFYARRDLQQDLRPSFAGGGSVDDHQSDEVVYTDGAARFEFGLQNYASQYAVPACIDFLTRFDRATVLKHMLELNTLARRRLATVPNLRFIGTSAERPEQASSICTFYVEGVDSHRVAELLDLVSNVQVRAGRQCAHHYYHTYHLPPSIRMSFGYHNTSEEVEYSVNALRTILKHYL